MAKRHSFYLFFILLFFTSINSFAQENVSSYAVNLKNETIQPTINAQLWFDSMNQHYKLNVPIEVLLQFQSIPNQNQLQQLSSSGITVIEYVPHNTYTSILHFPIKNLDITSVGIRSVITMNPYWKIDEKITDELNLHSDKEIKVLLSFNLQDFSLNEIQLLLQQAGATIINKQFEQSSAYEISISQNKIVSLAKAPFVKYIGIVPELHPLNDDCRASTGSALLQSTSGIYGLDGTGVTLGIGDINSAIEHVDARDRVTDFNPGLPEEHGNHTTLTAAGKGIMDPKTIGMAPNAKILAHYFDLVWSQIPSMFPDYNMTLTNNSYAAVVGDCSYAGTYDQYAQMLDNYAIQYPEVENVFSSGNDGLLTCGAYPAGYHTVTGGYQASKDVLTVGATLKNDTIWWKSSRGPVKDGRLKPEVVAFGATLFSGNIYDMYGPSNGTSMSCPVVTGCLALLEQRYKQLHSNQNAPGSLLKALVMNGAIDWGNPGPDFIYGFGQMNDYRAIQMLDSNRYKIDSLNNNTNSSFNINVPANTAQLKVMLYWHDPSASLIAAKALVNDLDLEVKEPNNTIHHPLILDPAPANAANNAVEGIDTLNNVEQVVLNNPTNGSYTITVKGTSIPVGKQQFDVVYDFIPVGIKIKYPNTGTPLAGNDTMRIYWDASDNPNTFSIEYSINGGANWNMITNNVGSTIRHYFWNVPNVASSQAMVRITRNNTTQQDVTGVFTICPQPNVQLDAVQCPGYLAFNWNAIPGVSGYQILKKIGADLVPIDTVTTTNYVFSGLSYDTIYYAVVCPLVNGVPGFRSKAVSRMPNDGTCTGSISDGDMRVDGIVSPGSGRLFTSTALTNNQTLSVNIRNLDDAPANSYKVSYSLNGSAWQSQTLTSPIAALGNTVVNFTGLDLSAIGTYQIKVAVENLAMNDPVKSNDTITKYIRQLNNLPIDLNASFTDDFENTPVINQLIDSVGITPNDHWDFANSTDSGRIRSFVSSDVLIDGQRSISLDLLMSNGMENQNDLTGTFNLQAYDAHNIEARLQFDYKIHGQPKFLSGNEVWVRGNDADPWVNIFTFDTAATPGLKINTSSLSITNALLNSNQNFSSSFQVRIGQHDTAQIAANDYGNGITIDNFKLYSVTNDVQLLSIVNPVNLECGLDSSLLTLKIYNSDNLAQQNVRVNYQLDNGTIVSDTISSIASKDTILFTFPNKINIANVGPHIINAWIVAIGDSYLSNDSIMNYQLRNQPYITAFPYLENFETSDGGWFTAGIKSSWQYGKPNSTVIKTAASGSKVWMTNLNGNYNDNEQSYLYSPCFDVSGMTSPMLSFSIVNDIEYCGNTLCDEAYVEYSEDGITWNKLGTNGQGTNWYGNLQGWTNTDTRWRVASISLPTGIAALKLRFVMKSDAGTNKDGIAIDDIHIFDLQNPAYEGGSVSTNDNVNASAMDFISNGQIFATIDPHSQNIGTTTVQMFRHTSPYNIISNQYNLSRNYVVNASQLKDSAMLRLFITDDDVIKYLADNTCDTCNKAADAYRLGITKYDDANKQNENGSLSDNLNGTYNFIPYAAIQWVPYDKGYYAQINVASFSEFWFNTHLPGKILVSSLVYPNPVFDRTVHIIWHATPGENMNLVLYDVLGRVVYKANATATDYDNNSAFVLPDIETGIYTLRYFMGSEIKTVKLSVVR